MQSWKRLAPRRHLDLELTLLSGQCFNWKVKATDRLTGFVPGKDFSSPYIVSLQQSSDDVSFLCHNSADVGNIENALVDYFQLNEDMERLYDLWGAADARLKIIGETLPGLRILRQEPIECLFSFICSSNNNIARITLMLDALRKSYGAKVCSVEGEDFYAFPTVQAMAATPVDDLKSLGLGYRAKYIQATAATVEEKGVDWLYSLRKEDRKVVQKELTQLSGVGQKVADCVALFSLDKSDVIPVDTHVWDVACRDFDASLNKTKSLTPKVYEKVGDIFRKHFRERPGWAHSLLFAAELPRFRRRLPQGLQESMAAWESEKKASKAKKKAETKASTPKEPKVAQKTKKRSVAATEQQEPTKRQQVEQASSDSHTPGGTGLTTSTPAAAPVPKVEKVEVQQTVKAEGTASNLEGLEEEDRDEGKKWTRSYIRKKNIELEDLARRAGIKLFTLETRTSVQLDEAMLRGVLGPMREDIEGIE